MKSLRMDIREWLSKGLTQKFKDGQAKKSQKGQHALDSSDEEPKATNIPAKKVKVAVSPKEFFKKNNYKE